jgi:DNA-binding Lrp family transcriptional regulator
MIYLKLVAFSPCTLRRVKSSLRKVVRMTHNEKDLLILSQLRRNARMKLTDMSKATKIPVSTLFDRIILYKDRGLVKKYTALVRFEDFGYKARALVIFSAKNREDREKLFELLDKHRNVNCLFKVNNGWDYMAEVVFPGIKEVEDFLDDVEEKVRLKNKKIFYVIDELKKEEFLASPHTASLGGRSR